MAPCISPGPNLCSLCQSCLTWRLVQDLPDLLYGVFKITAALM